MGVIAIAANPNSGKDIRRLVTHATVIDNVEKVNILRRIIQGTVQLGGHEIWMMPDRYKLAQRTLDGLSPEARARVRLLPQGVTDTQRDTTAFVEEVVHDKGADVVIVLGGDGTCRAAAKSIGDVPMIAVSTGTNNVYPQLVEGTAVAMAASAIAGGLVNRRECGPRGKRINIDVGGRVRDMALIDAVVCRLGYTGARAILDAENIEAILATQCHPATIGFSALAGSVDLVTPRQPGGLYLEPDWRGDTHIAAISAGVMERFGLYCARRVREGEILRRRYPHDGTIAVDGERELSFRADEVIEMTIAREGPRKVGVPEVVSLAAQRGLLGRAPSIAVGRAVG